MPKNEQMRKAFNFFRSYWEVANELNDKDRLAFYDAIMKRQFTGVESELEGITRFAYLSQKFSIDSQVQGYIDKTKDPLMTPTEGGIKGGVQGPSVQEKGKEKGKEKENTNIVPFKNGTTIEKIDFDGLLTYINNTFGRKFKTITEPIRKKYNARMKEGYKKADITNAINNCHKDQFHRDHNYKYCTPEFFSRSEILEKYSEVTKQEKIITAFHPIVFD
jgi:uncharacterized phage protein (TIGR02220 family)